MITAPFTHALQRETDRKRMRFLLILQEVKPMSKTRNQFIVYTRNFATEPLVPHEPHRRPIGSLPVWLQPGEILDDGLGGTPGRAPRPPLERFDAEPDHVEVV